MRPSRNRNWGNPELIRFIERFATNAKKVGWNGLLVGDMSQPRGGPMLSEHTSHQIGLDVDIWFAPMPDHVQSREEREFGSATDVVAPDLRDVDPKEIGRAHVSSHLGISYAVFCLKKKKKSKIDRDKIKGRERTPHTVA